jgi:hypothetical protein
LTRDWNDDRRALLTSLQNMGSSGRAEGTPIDRIAAGFYPVAEHLRLLDSEVVLVVGPRGSGKTEIARVLTDASLYESVKNFAPAVRLPSGVSEWVKVYPAGSKGFEGIGLKTYLQSVGDSIEETRNLWFAYLVRALESWLEKSDKSELEPLLKCSSADVLEVSRAFNELGTKSVIALDRLDSQLEKKNRYLFTTFDELDTLGNGDWKLVESGVKGLVALWAAYSRRWKRLRAKVFLRTDLYERHAKAGGADLAKLAAGRVELVWSDRDLYGQLLKRIANTNTDLANYVQVKGIF